MKLKLDSPWNFIYISMVKTLCLKTLLTVMTTPPRKRNTQKRKSKKHLHTNLKKFKDHRNLVSVFLKRGKSSYQGLYYNNN